jgi:hypothetical protein
MLGLDAFDNRSVTQKTEFREAERERVRYAQIQIQTQIGAICSDVAYWPKEGNCFDASGVTSNDSEELLLPYSF